MGYESYGDHEGLRARNDQVAAVTLYVVDMVRHLASFSCPVIFLVPATNIWTVKDTVHFNVTRI
jgi:hypothetical protein